MRTQRDEAVVNSRIHNDSVQWTMITKLYEISILILFIEQFWYNVALLREITLLR